MAFKPNGIKVGTSILTQDTTVGNLNFFKCAEGFLESFPQSVYQLSLVLRTISGEEWKVFLMIQQRIDILTNRDSFITIYFVSIFQ